MTNNLMPSDNTTDSILKEDENFTDSIIIIINKNFGTKFMRHGHYFLHISRKNIPADINC